MLIVAKKLSDLRFSALAEVYDLASLQDEQDLYAFLREDFFPRGMCCVWEEKGRYVSTLRLQPYRDGWLLEGLQTHADHRGRGYAKQLIGAALEALKMEKVYSHISRDNAPSIAAHLSCGFRRILNYATYLDGSVYHTSDTYLYENQAAN